MPIQTHAGLAYGHYRSGALFSERIDPLEVAAAQIETFD